MNVSVSLDCELIDDLVRAVVRLPTGELNSETDLVDAGLDSLQRIALIEALESEAGAPFDDQTIEGLLMAVTMGEIYETLERR